MFLASLPCQSHGLLHRITQLSPVRVRSWDKQWDQCWGESTWNPDPDTSSTFETSDLYKRVSAVMISTVAADHTGCHGLELWPSRVELSCERSVRGSQDSGLAKNRKRLAKRLFMLVM